MQENPKVSTYAQDVMSSDSEEEEKEEDN